LRVAASPLVFVLFACKRAHNALGLLPTFCGCAPAALFAKNQSPITLLLLSEKGHGKSLGSLINAFAVAFLPTNLFRLRLRRLIFNSTLHILHSTLFTPLKKIFPFSVRIMLSAIFTQLNNNIMNLLLGRYYGETNTGHYNQAYQWSSKCFLLVGNMLKQVDQTVLVGLRDERERQLAVLRKMVRFTAFISFPLLFGLGLVSHEFIVLAIGQKWAFSASLLPLLCLCGAFMPLSTLLTDSIISQHRSDIYLWSTIALGVLQIALMVSLWREGIYVMVIAYTILNILWMFVWHQFVRRLMHYRLLHFLKDILPFALAAAAVMIVTRMVTEFTVDSLRMTDDYLRLWLLLLSRVVIAATLYYGVMRLSGAVILKEIQAFLRAKLTSRG
jgi:O-antigen/teichoic acid export membrane protein